MSDFALVGLMPTYREGPLVRTACASLLAAGLDRVFVWEGPAGTDRLDDAPATDLGGLHEHVEFREATMGWGSDAAKRSEMLHFAVRAARKQTGDPRLPVWGMWLDADEQLVNGWVVRDLVQERTWHDEAVGASIATAGNMPTGGIPLRLVEYDGTCSFAKGRLVRLDLIRRFVVSNLIIETVLGNQMRLGNAPEGNELYRMAEEHFPDRHVVSPPLPGEAVIVHRSHLRHPARKGSRLHMQELAELEALGLPVTQPELKAALERAS